MDPQSSEAEIRRLIAEKAERLEELRQRKPGQKGYKRSLKAFLDADAQAQRALIDLIENECRCFEEPRAEAKAEALGLSPAPNADEDGQPATPADPA